MTHAELCRRYVVFFLGVCFAGLGISLITKSGLGTSAVSSLSYVMTFVSPLSLGLATLLVNTACLLAQILLLRSQFPKIQLLQLPATAVFSAVIDLCMFLLAPVAPQAYFVRIVILLAGCVFLGFGVALEVLADVLFLPGEGIVRVLSQKSGREFGTIKTLFDMAMVASAALLSLIGLGHVAGIREGTLIAALTVGGISRFFRVHLMHWIPLRASSRPRIVRDTPEPAAHSI